MKRDDTRGHNKIGSAAHDQPSIMPYGLFGKVALRIPTNGTKPGNGCVGRAVGRLGGSGRLPLVRERGLHRIYVWLVRPTYESRIHHQPGYTYMCVYSVHMAATGGVGSSTKTHIMELT